MKNKFATYCLGVWLLVTDPENYTHWVNPMELVSKNLRRKTT